LIGRALIKAKADEGGEAYLDLSEIDCNPKLGPIKYDYRDKVRDLLQKMFTDANWKIKVEYTQPPCNASQAGQGSEEGEPEEPAAEESPEIKAKKLHLYKNREGVLSVEDIILNFAKKHKRKVDEGALEDFLGDIETYWMQEKGIHLNEEADAKDVDIESLRKVMKQAWHGSGMRWLRSEERDELFDEIAKFVAKDLSGDSDVFVDPGTSAPEDTRTPAAAAQEEPAGAQEEPAAAPPAAAQEEPAADDDKSKKSDKMRKKKIRPRTTSAYTGGSEQYKKLSDSLLDFFIKQNKIKPNIAKAILDDIESQITSKLSGRVIFKEAKGKKVKGKKVKSKKVNIAKILANPKHKLTPSQQLEILKALKKWAKKNKKLVVDKMKRAKIEKYQKKFKKRKSKNENRAITERWQKIAGIIKG